MLACTYTLKYRLGELTKTNKMTDVRETAIDICQIPMYVTLLTKRV